MRTVLEQWCKYVTRLDVVDGRENNLNTVHSELSQRFIGAKQKCRVAFNYQLLKN